MPENTPPRGPSQTDTTSARAESKRRILLEGLERGLTLVRLDARRPGVRVPDRLSNEFGLALNLSWRFPHTEMVVNERGFAATLRFGGVAHRCVVPWSAVWGIVPAGQEGTKVWPLDLPPELDGPERSPHEEEPALVEPMRPKLQVLRPAAVEAEPVPVAPPASDATAEDSAPAPVSEEPTAEKPRAPWLRLVR